MRRDEKSVHPFSESFAPLASWIDVFPLAEVASKVVRLRKGDL